MVSLYLETTIPSYLAARPSRDIIVLAHQQITHDWWNNRRHDYDIYISPVVIEEIKIGDHEMVEKRMQLISDFKILEATRETEKLAQIYLLKLNLPEKAIRDAAHLAFACIYGIEFLLTWNCAHIANAEIRRHLLEINLKENIWTPIICTPEELMGTEVI